MKRTAILFATALLGLSGILAGCNNSTSSEAPTAANNTLSVLASSELKDLEPDLKRMAAEVGTNLVFNYKGSVDIMNELDKKTSQFDVVWPSSSIWLSLGDKSNRLRDKTPIFSSPVVFAVKASVAKRLAWEGKQISIAQILTAAKQNNLRWAMTSATQSNSGAMAYLGYLASLSGKTSALTSADLNNAKLTTQMRELLRTIDRSAASTGFQTDRYLEDPSTIDAMVTYESEVIRANQDPRGSSDPLYAFYPQGGTAIADYPIASMNPSKSDLFAKLKERLLKEDAQSVFLSRGRRKADLGITIANADQAVFNPAWGIDTKKIITPITMPSAATLQEALALYQSALRKPSLTVYVLDYSGSMGSNGGEKQLKTAMRMLLDPAQSKRYFLQPTKEDITIVIPFSSGNPEVWQVRGNDPTQLAELLNKIESRNPDGETMLHQALGKALRHVRLYPSNGTYFKSIILMSDGQPTDQMSDLEQSIGGHPLGSDIPIFTIGFGDADANFMKGLSDKTHAKAFDGAKDLQTAFRDAKGYN